MKIKPILTPHEHYYSSQLVEAVDAQPEGHYMPSGAKVAVGLNTIGAILDEIHDRLKKLEEI